MSGLTRFEIGFWLLATVCALAALAWLASSLDALAGRLAARRAARKPVPYTLTPAGEQITWEPGGTIDTDLRGVLQPRIWPVRTRVGQPGCEGIPCIWFDNGTLSACAAHDTRIAARRATREQRMAQRLIAEIEQELRNT